MLRCENHLACVVDGGAAFEQGHDGRLMVSVHGDSQSATCGVVKVGTSSYEQFNYSHIIFVNG